MNDESPFASFVPSTPEVEAPAKAKDKKGGKTRKKKTAAKLADVSAASSVVAAPTTKTKKARKTRAAKAPREMKIGLQAAMNAMAGLTESDCLAVEKAAAVIADGSRKSRQRIVAALAKLFG